MPHPQAETFDEFVEAIEQINREYGDTYCNSSGSDWRPSIWMNQPQVGVVGIVLPPPFIDGDVPKDALAAAMEKLVTVSGCNMAAFSSSSWMVKPEGHEAERTKAEKKDLDSRGKKAETYGDLGMPRPSEHPDRIEAVVIFAADEDGRQAVSIGEITRDESDVPSLGEYERMYVGEEEDNLSSMDGRFVEPLQRAMMRRKAAQN